MTSHARFHLFAAFIHLILTSISLFLWMFHKNSNGERRDLVYPLHSTYSAWNVSEAKLMQFNSACNLPKTFEFNDMRVAPMLEYANIDLSLHWLVTGFLAVSSFFQFLATIKPEIEVAYVIRFMEYSLSAVLMITAISLQVGITESTTLMHLGVLTWATMICGLVTETLLVPKVVESHAEFFERQLQLQEMYENKQTVMTYDNLTVKMARAAVVAHLVGWVAIGTVFYTILSHFHASQIVCIAGSESTRSAPTFVWAIVYVELILFGSFGSVQVMHILGWLNAEQADTGYTILSVVSKNVLAGLVYGGNFV